MKKSNSVGGALAALTANIIFGFSFLFLSVALGTGAPPMVIVSVRFTAALAILIVLRVLGVIKINIKGKRLLPVIIMGLCQPFLYFICETYGVKQVSTSIAGVIIALVPVAVIIINSLFFGSRPTATQTVCSIISVCGVIAISVISSGGKAEFSAVGVVLLIAAVVTAALFNVLSDRLSGEFTAAERTYIMFIIAAVGFNALSVCMYGGRFFTLTAQALTDLKFTLPVIGYLAAASSVAAFLLMNYATENIGAVRSASFSNIISVCSVFAGVVILKEDVNVWQLLCCAVIIIGVFGANRSKNQERTDF